MRMLLMVLAGCAMHANSWASAPIDVVILCDAGYPPYSYAEGDEAKGLYTDILRTAFTRMPEYNVHIRPVPWARGLAEVASGRAFALYPPYHRPNARPWMDFSRPILREKVVVFVRAELARIRTVEHFPFGYSGLRIGVNRGFMSIDDQDYQSMLATGALKQSYANDNRTNLARLYHGRIDVYINDRLSVQWELEQMQRESIFAQSDLNWLVEGPWLSGEAGYLGYTRLNASAYPYKPKFMQRLDEILAELERDGSIERLTKSYDLVNPLYSPGDGI
ncbi:substrate-binding periplasmic protein [Pseudomonas migulae]|jgi:polar amino acid transport system substrate-binding protein|uniref:Transporter substrate-binding domain-containing protein n=1 Tax=Pseudomonas migulae TaxID=78543 RepID=A0ABY8MYA4_9PSED|nr:transporter substrate-binding domain-containing protein [Pseudomonas migulae]WGK91561.1 transporter substrate-binding domain-containing protein [Pseudomonas migulae]